ncbi:hypothetical protein [Amycolatopsis sp. CA-126428]|uniref:hypothetical protein n=1 Tax=Amycolatopsis sp. CA-126428 TaxID=2073158 RepID=UPI000CD2D531|nr:hypothetical protein [Amycolatopsis sp. CA-126428]
MKELTVSEDVYTEVRILANAWEVSNDRALKRLLDWFRAGAPVPGAEDETVPAEPVAPTTLADASARPLEVIVPVVGKYRGKVIEANFFWPSECVEITTGPHTGRRFLSPSGAATEIVRAINPDVHPNRNGWDFFRDRKGFPLRMVRFKLREQSPR